MPGSFKRIAFRAALVCCLLLVSVEAIAQETADVPVVTRAVAIRNARIVQAPGRVIPRGTVLMRDGLITAVGPMVPIPYDAEVIDGDSLVVYAGFIDGLSHAGIPTKERERRPESVNASDPPPDLAGVQPQKRARELIDPADKSIAQLREAGFTAAHVVPRNGMLPGLGSVVLLTGSKAEAMVLKPDVSLFMQFEGGRGVYPSTAMGVMAHLRQLVREAQRRRRLEDLYAQNPAGLERPAFDPIHEAVYPLLNRQRPLFILANGNDSALEVHRALQLEDELDLSIALAGLDQGFDVADDLSENPVPLFVTLDLPDGKADSSRADSTAAPFDPTLRTRSYADVDREKENREARRAMERKRYASTAAVLHDAGLRFGFSTRDARPSRIRKNVLTMIEAGLPEDAALAALTIDGARLLGLERSLGTVEEGKLANLVVTRGSYFDEKNRIRFVFVDGWKYEYEEAKKDTSVSIAGRWELTTSIQEADLVAVMTLRMSAGSVSGDIEFPEGSSTVTVDDASLVGRRLEFTFDTAQYGQVRAELTVTGDSLTGTFDIPGEGAVDVAGARSPEKERR